MSQDAVGVATTVIPYNTNKPLPLYQNQTICIVGGHDNSIVDSWLNQSDFVVGVNANYKRQGFTPDIYFGGNYDEPEPEGFKFKHVYINRSDNLSSRLHWGEELFSFCRQRTIKPKPDPRDEWLNTFQHEINGNPLSGMIALKYFSLLPVKKIYLCGMDFYQDENKKILDYVWPHNVKEQSTWARELWRLDTRVEYSPHLMELLRLNGETKGLPFRDFSGVAFYFS